MNLNILLYNFSLGLDFFDFWLEKCILGLYEPRELLTLDFDE